MPEVRKDNERYFKLSGIRETKQLSHTPFMIFRELEDVVVELCHNAKALLENYPDETKVLAQWKGQWSSDFFSFTVGEFREYVKNNPKENYHIV